MNTCAGCGAEVVTGGEGAEPVCPACLLRLALAPANTDDDGPSAFPRLIGPVGRGPTGTVYLGYRAHEVPRFVTVKIIDPLVDLERFGELIRDTSTRLGATPQVGVPRILEPGETDAGRAYVLAEYVAGPAIATHVAGHRGAADDRLRLIQDLCTLVADLHERGIVHGSIKSSNVVVTDSPAGPVLALLDVGVKPAIEQSRIGAPLLNTPPANAGVAADVRALQTLVLQLIERESEALRSIVRDAGPAHSYQSAAELAADVATGARRLGRFSSP